MIDLIILIRNSVIVLLYKVILKPLLFLMDPEKAHDLFIRVGNFLGKNSFLKKLTGVFFRYSNDKFLSQNIRGINFPNPIGLAAGFDKDAHLTDILPDVGFGYTEVGSITAQPCPGNPKPRVWRLKKSKGLVIYYGLKNDGCEVIRKRLTGKKSKIPLGISIAKTNSETTVTQEQGIKDYLKSYEHFSDLGDYFAINISCPNAYGGEPFTKPESLRNLLEALQKVPKSKPVFLKMPPGLTGEPLDIIINLAREFNVDGFICTNLSKNRNNPLIVEKDLPEKGSISGKVVEEDSNKMIAEIYQKTKNEFVIIGCGGIFSAADAYKKIRLGASLLQLITSMIFEGPQVISEINRGLVRLLKKDGFKNISEAVGKGNNFL